MQAAWFALVKSWIFGATRSVTDESDDLTSHNRLKCTIQKKTWRQKNKTKAKIGKRAIPLLVNMQFVQCGWL